MIGGDAGATSAGQGGAERAERGDVQKIRIELAREMQEIMGNFVADHTDLYKHYADDPLFKKLMLDMAFQAVYQPPTG